MGFDYFADDRKDVLGALQPLMDKGACFINDDGKIEFVVRNVWRTPWIQVRRVENSRCSLYSDVMFPHFHIVPARCQACWKVVARPRTVVELFKVLDYQLSKGLPSKCGIERREYTAGLYGAYWYNTNVEQGLDCLDTVRRDLEELLGPGVKVLLKRGCTEMEQAFPVSLNWTITDEQRELEDYIERCVVYPVDDGSYHEPDYLRLRVKRSWVEWAARHGDASYLELTGGRPLSVPYVTYERGPNGQAMGFLPETAIAAPGEEGSASSFPSSPPPDDEVYP